MSKKADTGGDQPPVTGRMIAIRPTEEVLLMLDKRLWRHWGKNRHEACVKMLRHCLKVAERRGK